MQRLIYAFRFIKACFSLAIKHPRLRKPWFYLWMGGISLLVMWLIPLGVVTSLVGLRPLGMILIGLISILLVFSLLIWGEITALETCRNFDVLIVANDEQPDTENPQRDFFHWKDIFLWVLALPGLEVIHGFNQVFRPRLASDLAWLSASYLILPVISLENLTLMEAVERIKQLVRDHLLRFHPDLIGVRLVAGVVQWVLILVGTVCGYWVGLTIADPLTASLLSRLLAITLGVALAGFMALLGIFFSSFSRACYYTSLYQWNLNVEFARRSGDASKGLPPTILSQVLGKTK